MIRVNYIDSNDRFLSWPYLHPDIIWGFFSMHARGQNELMG